MWITHDTHTQTHTEAKQQRTHVDGAAEAGNGVDVGFARDALALQLVTHDLHGGSVSGTHRHNASVSGTHSHNARRAYEHSDTCNSDGTALKQRDYAKRHAHGPHREGVRLGTDEDDAVLVQLLGKMRPLRQEAVAGVHSLRAGLQARLDNLVGVQVALGRGRGADEVAVVGLEHVLLATRLSKQKNRCVTQTSS
jgi:hypothetical protein